MGEAHDFAFINKERKKDSDKSSLTLEIPWMIACQFPMSMGFSRKEYWSGLPFPSPGELPNPVVEPRSPTLQADVLPTELHGKLLITSIAFTTSFQILPSCRSSDYILALNWRAEFMPQAVTHLRTAQYVQDPTIATFQQFNCLVGKKKYVKNFFGLLSTWIY